MTANCCAQAALLPASTPAIVSVSAARFNRAAADGLQAMRKRAEELKVGGVAVLAYFEGDKIESWSSKMLVVGRIKDAPT